MGSLTARKVETLTAPGRHSDGDNLYLTINGRGGKSWVFFYRFQGKRKEMGLGSAAPGHENLRDARRKALAARKLIDEGIDPLAHKAAQDRATAQEKAIAALPSFGIFADQYLADHRSKFRNAKHVAQWQMTLAKYCLPIRSTPINEIDTEAVLSVLQPIWQKVPETASRLRGRIENVMDAARARGLFQGENPARWRGHLKAILPARQRLTRGHHAALPYDELPAFLSELRTKQSIAGLALEFCILTAARSGEVLGASWREFDLAKAIWTIPAARMKAGHEHRIPLSAHALAILKVIPREKGNDHVFPGAGRNKALSGMAMAMLLRRMDRETITVHGFRSTFRDWASEQTSFPHETCEHALAHRISDKAEAAYRRGDQFEKRRKLMDTWASYCAAKVGGKVVPLRKA